MQQLGVWQAFSKRWQRSNTRLVYRTCALASPHNQYYRVTSVEPELFPRSLRLTIAKLSSNWSSCNSHVAAMHLGSGASKADENSSHYSREQPVGTPRNRI